MNKILLICLIICISISSASCASTTPSMIVKNSPLSPGKVSTFNPGGQGHKNTCANDECNGVCTNTQSDRSNCGGCGVVCDSGWKCLQGSCVPPKAKSGVVTVSKLNNTQPSGHNVSRTLKTGLSAANLSATNISTTNKSATNLSAAYLSAKLRNAGGVLPPLRGTGGNSIVGANTGYTCEGLTCACSGDEDCNDMFLHGGCGDIAQCSSDGTCWCFKRL
jgi:hypothetical protein